MLCVFDLDCRKVYKSKLAVGLSGFLEHTVILSSTELLKGRQADRQAGRHVGRQAGRQMQTHTGRQ